MLDVADLMVKIMNEAAQHGHIPEKVRLSTEMVIKTGRVVLMSKRIEQVRHKLGLKPPPEVPMDEVEGILEETGLTGLIG
jgi:heterodisulfide reductase subunit C